MDTTEHNQTPAEPADAVPRNPMPSSPGTTDDPIWLNWHEPEVADLTHEQLQAYADDWSSQAERWLRKRRRVTKEHPDAYRFSYSQWWCSKRHSIALREQARRLLRKESTLD